MSVLCLHGVVPAEAARPDASGLMLHVRLDLGPVSVLVSELPEVLEDEAASLDAILAHDLLLGAYLACGPVLPVRFGTCFSDVAALHAALMPQLDALAAQVQGLTGLAEYALTAEPGAGLPPAPVVSVERPASGRDFLKARKARRDAGRQAADSRGDVLRDLYDRACALAEDSDLRPPRAPRLLSLSLLMTRAQAAELQAHVSQIATDSGLALRLTGPFPAYSFARLPEGEPVAGAASDQETGHG